MEGKALHSIFKGAKYLQIGEQEKKLCYFYTLETDQETEASVSHHILLVDVSGSMSGEIEALKVRVKQTLDVLKTGGNRYVSIIIYSGHEESYRIVNAVKCDTLSYKMARVYESVEQELYTRSITVMSEPLETALTIVKDLGEVCHKHHLLLMTDGCLVPGKWDVKTEEAKCMVVAELCKEQGIYFDAIGFGPYYDRALLRKLVETAKTGQMLHVDTMKDYYKSMLALVHEVTYKQQVNHLIEEEDFFVLHQCERYKAPIYLKTIPTNEPVLMVVFKDEGEEEGEVEEALIENLFYGLTLHYIVQEDIDSAEITVAQTQDIGAYKCVKGCYSFLEKGKAMQTLSECLREPEKRHKQGKGLIRVAVAEEEPLCLLEVLQMLLEDKGSKLLWDYSYPYKRMGVKTSMKDEDYQFIRPSLGYGEVVDVVMGAEKLNIGIKVKIEGSVEEKATGIKVAASIYRDYNLIVNGNRNVDLLWCELSKETRQKLRKEKLIKKLTKVGAQKIYTLDLTKLKATNRRMLKSLNQQQLAHYLYDVEVLGCKQWAIKKCLGKEEGIGELEEAVDTIQSRFHLDRFNVYRPTQVVKDESLPYEIYPATVLIWKVEKFPKKKYQDEMIKFYENWDETQLQEELYKVRQEKKLKQNRISLVRIAVGLMEKSVFLWEKQIEKQKVQTDKVLGMNSIIGEKVQISTKTFEDIQLREDRYTVLTKCN